MSRELHETAYKKFWDRLEVGDLAKPVLFPYELCRDVQTRNWPTFTGLMVSGELQESINQLNRWSMHLYWLRAWDDVLLGYDEIDAWKIRNQFVEAIAHFCIFQPSAARDRLGRIASNAVHQANLATINGYRDELEQDRRRSGKHLKRYEVERQLNMTGVHWTSTVALLQALQQLDDSDCRKRTFDFRNRASHYIAPRIEFGFVTSITREIVPATEMVKQPDGYYRAEEISGKKVVSYGFGETSPLPLKEVIDANWVQHQRAIHAHGCYSSLLVEMLATMPANS